MSEDPEIKALIGGQSVDIGDAILCRDDESNAWWRASIRDIRGSDVLVTFMGCDDAWDTWMDSASADLMVMDDVEKKKDASAFQSDTYENSLTDEEMLEEYRQKRWDDNARWQLQTFASAQTGSWSGTVDIYEADSQKPGGVRKVAGPWAPECSADVTIVSNDAIEMRETLPGPVAAMALPDMRMGAESFRPERGNMAVASAFSLATKVEATMVSSPSEDLVLEIAIREGARRVRCKLLYAADEAATGAVEDGGVGAKALRSVAIVREALGGSEFGDGMEGDADLDGSPGRGLYDTPPGDKLNYVSIYGETGVTLVCPLVVAAGEGGCMSLDWIAGKMRYQIDRKFKLLDGSLSSLELTEIQKDDAETYLPDFPHQGGGAGR